MTIENLEKPSNKKQHGSKLKTLIDPLGWIHIHNIWENTWMKIRK